MVIPGIPREDIRHTRAVQDWLAEGRQEGLQAGLQEGKALEAAKRPSANSTAAAAPSRTPRAPRSRPYQWISWKPWP